MSGLPLQKQVLYPRSYMISVIAKILQITEIKVKNLKIPHNIHINFIKNFTLKKLLHLKLNLCHLGSLEVFFNYGKVLRREKREKQIIKNILMDFFFGTTALYLKHCSPFDLNCGIKTLQT